MSKKEKLLIVWSSSDREVALKLPLLYGSVILPREYWKEAHLMVWGPSIKLVAEDSEIQAQVKKVLATGVQASTCIVCSDDYGVTDVLEEMGIEPIHTGELLTEALKSDEWSVMTI
ncbi:MAG: DsrE family protein [Campylobacterota bacterium]|nr:DsrE family protein [Campylobacterota bacterium]